MTVGRLLALDPDPASQGTAFQLSALLEPPNLSQMYGTFTESCIHNGGYSSYNLTLNVAVVCWQATFEVGTHFPYIGIGRLEFHSYLEALWGL